MTVQIRNSIVHAAAVAPLLAAALALPAAPLSVYATTEHQPGPAQQFELPPGVIRHSAWEAKPPVGY
ncbi:MAG: hypothetical protein ACRELT_01305, partial [Longimicrobiales bacterium]